MAAARGEAAWLARDLIPTVQAQSQDQLRGAWAVASPRAVALEDQLVALSATAPDDAARAGVTALLTAVRGATSALERLNAPGAVDSPAARGELLDAGRQVEQALAAGAGPAGAGGAA